MGIRDWGSGAGRRSQAVTEVVPEAITLRKANRLAPRGVEPLAVIIFFTLLTLIMTWPWALHAGEAINPFGDVVVQMTSLQWNAHALVTNPFGLFEAPFFYPYAHSLAFSENLIGQTLVALPLLWLTGNPALANNFNILLSFVLTGVFTYLLVRDLTGSRAAGVFAGVAFAFCPFRFMQMGHLHMLSTQWFPFTLWALRGALGIGGQGSGVGDFESLRHQPANIQRRDAESAEINGAVAGAQHASPSLLSNRPLLSTFLTAFGFIMMGLSSVYYIYFLALAVLLYFVWWLTSRWLGSGSAKAEATQNSKLKTQNSLSSQSSILSPLPRLLMAALLVALFLGPVFVPYLQSNRDLGFSRSTYEVQNWAADWSFYGTVLQSNWLYAQVLAPQMATTSGERQLFPGVVPTILALVGLVWGMKRERFFYALLGFVALVLTFGLSGRIPGTDVEVTLPYAFLYDWVPGFKALRVPVRFAVLVDLALYVLAGYGLARLVRTGDGRRETAGDTISTVGRSSSVVRRLPSAVPTLALTALVLLEFANPLDTSNRQDVTAQLREIEPYGWLARPENAGPVLELPMSAGQEDVWYTFFATKHWQPLVNGWSSFVPPGTVHMARALERFPDPQTVSLLQGLEVRHVVVHLWQFDEGQQAGLKRRLDEMPQLELVRQDGENYVYRLAPDPWLRRVAEQVGDGTLWIGEARQGAMPTLEVLAYALKRFGVRAEQIGGNINIGYNPVGSLPFGTAPDYILIPDANGSSGLPFGYASYESTRPAVSNSAVRLLKRHDALLAGYDWTHRAAPQVAETVKVQVSPSKLAFDESLPVGREVATRTVELTFLAFTPAEVTLRSGESEERLKLDAGISRYMTAPFKVPSELTIAHKGDARLLRTDLWAYDFPPASKGGTPLPTLDVMPLETTTLRGASTLDTRLRVVPPKGESDFTATIDVYVEPWGTHPEGHFGNWSVVLPADGTGHDYLFRLDPLAKSVTTTRDGQPIETFGWVGPPTEGDFRATLTVTRGEEAVANIPLYLFTLKGSRLTGTQLEPASLNIAQPGVKVGKERGYLAQRYGWWALDWKAYNLGFELAAPISDFSLERLLEIAASVESSK